MHVILATVNCQFALVHLYDTVIFFVTPENYIRNIREVLTLFNNAGSNINLKKCQFFTRAIEYLGHVIRQRRLKNALHTNDADRSLQEPTKTTELICFLGV